MDREVQKAQALVHHLQGRRILREPRWKELSRWLYPARGMFEDEGPDREWEDDLRFNHAPMQAVLRGASGMTSGMTPRNAAWFKSDFGQPQLLEVTGARQWLDEVDRLMRDCLANGGFYQAIQAFNIDLLWAGCALLYSERSEQNVLNFECVQIGTFVLQTSRHGELEAVARKMRYTLESLEREFGRDKLLPTTRAKLETAPWDLQTVWQLVRLDGKGPKPVSSRYWEDGGQNFLREDGYYEMPFYFTCWHEGYTSYGTGPGDMALGEARQLDTLEKRKLEGLAKITDPPVVVPTELKGVLDLSPGALNFSPQNSQIRPLLDLSPFAKSLPALQQEIQVVTQRLEQSLYAAIFTSMPLDQRPKDMSATEFLERKRESLQQLGPVMSAYEPNVLTPLLHRILRALDRENKIPPLPEQLQGLPILLKMEFISPMANALRQTSAETARALFQDVASMAQASQNPELLDKLDCDQMVDELATALGAPGAIVRSDEEVAQIRQQRAQAQAEQSEMQRNMALAQGRATEASAMRDEAQAAQTLQAMEENG